MPASRPPGKCASFGLLWLTDLHFGQHGQKWLWPRLNGDFFSDLEHLHPECGPWDVVLFTGDLVFSGSKQEFDDLTPVLRHLYDTIKGLQDATPFFISIPGNHDLERPSEKSPAAVALRHWWHEDGVRNDFWENENSEYRRVIHQAFTAYTDWSAGHGFPRPPDYRLGALPGDFSATIANGDARLGIVGLNSTFLQLSDHNYQGKLDLHPRQLADACNGDPSAWLSQRHANFLLTHQPHGWLSKVALDQFRSEIYIPDKFAAHFHGHMHEHNARILSEGFGTPRRHFQGISLFGLEDLGHGVDTKRMQFGYSAVRLEIDPGRGRLYLWPRVAVQLQSGAWRLAPDSHVELAIGCQHTLDIGIDLQLPCGADNGGTASAPNVVSPTDAGRVAQDGSRLIQYLNQLRSESIARCIMRWQAASVSHQTAEEFANDPSIGCPSPEMYPNAQKPIVLLIGPIGSGKSLAGERLHQSAIEKALTNPDAAIPVYIEPNAALRLSDAVQGAMTSVDAHHGRGAAVFVHEAIGGDTADIRMRMNEARVLVNVRRNTTVVLLSRVSNEPIRMDESIAIPFLSPEAAFAIVNRVSGRRVSPTTTPLPESVREAIRRPLFALLLGHYFRTTNLGNPRSTADLIANLVSEAVREVSKEEAELYAILHSVATHLIDRGGGFIPISEVLRQEQSAILERLLHIGLITKRGDAIAFPLALLTEWFAAQSLADGTPDIDELAKDDTRLARSRRSSLDRSRHSAARDNDATARRYHQA